MVYLCNDLLNIIFSFVQRPPTNTMIKYVIEDCYENDYDPYADLYNHDGELHWYDDFCFQYSFVEWYFLYRKNYICNFKKNEKYKHTPKIILVGYEKKSDLFIK